MSRPSAKPLNRTARRICRFLAIILIPLILLIGGVALIAALKPRLITSHLGPESAAAMAVKSIAPEALRRAAADRLVELYFTGAPVTPQQRRDVVVSLSRFYARKRKLLELDHSTGRIGCASEIGTLALLQDDIEEDVINETGEIVWSWLDVRAVAPGLQVVYNPLSFDCRPLMPGARFGLRIYFPSVPRMRGLAENSKQLDEVLWMRWNGEQFELE